MSGSAASIVSVIVAVLLFEAGNSLLGVLLPLRGLEHAFSNLDFGALGAAYYVGFVAGCLSAGGAIRRFGHIRTFSALAAVTSSSVILTGLTTEALVWIVLRLATGYGLAGLFMVVESWLNEIAPNERRGRTLAIYMLAVWAATAAGKLALATVEPDSHAAFAFAAVAISLALVPVAMTTGVTPGVPRPVRFRVSALYATAPVAVVGCLVVGATNGAFWTLAPVFAMARAGTAEGVSIFMAAVVLGGALAQWPLGRLSDRTDRRRIVLLAAIVAALAGAALAWIRPSTDPALVALAMVFGAGALPIYSLCLAHANDHVAEGGFVEVGGQLLLLFGLGAMLGPLIASTVMGLLGPRGMFWFTATGHGGVALFTLYRLLTRVRHARPDWAPYAAVPRTTPQALALHPGGEHERPATDILPEGASPVGEALDK